MSKVARTNQLLYFARISLRSADEANGGQSKTMQEEIVLFQLYSALMSFAGELVAQYNLPAFKSLHEILTRDDYHGELVELRILYADSQSWLYCLVSQYERCLQQGLVVSQAPAGLILSQSDYQDLFSNWLIQLEKIICRMREHWQES